VITLGPKKREAATEAEEGGQLPQPLYSPDLAPSDYIQFDIANDELRGDPFPSRRTPGGCP
jgi:hypothetical protein